jgi:uncharacterized protein (DUF1786 family)
MKMNLEWRNSPPRSFRLKVALSILGIGIWVAERIHKNALDVLMDDMDMIHVSDALEHVEVEMRCV